ncbi:Phenylalanyl-tRNA synthetase beta chain [Spironucleus salmonicida]|uniref:phenylalanine--tRNA ligase n=1 Tax=Spironucleus salmonicida TaxID=348837 RepID=V6LSD9_9EUKA|nr:Phenylalanyl-tRNA synthetase beta chain [Spironucleus salmonicida]|eukprot:EST47587.1 Phenylalanyl-tRNA synthetase beta chain [Spironucleus salmonicida]
MPTVSVSREYFIQLFGEDISDSKLDEIMASYGIELDEIIDEAERNCTVPIPTYKVDVSANRGDLLCAENIVRVLRVFLGKDEYQTVNTTPSGITINVDPSTAIIRPYIVAAVVKNVSLNQRSYNSFIDHQDKLHHNVCRRRSLGAIGTHDMKKMDTSKITYTAESPKNIIFKALNQAQKLNGDELFEVLESDKKLQEFLQLIQQSHVWPVIRDATGEVLSLPPIINSEYSKIDLTTTDIFIEVTATDLTKGNIALNSVVSGLLAHSSTPCEVQSVDVHYQDISSAPLLRNLQNTTPDLSARTFSMSLDQAARVIGLTFTPEEAISYLQKMSIKAIKSANNGLICTVPFERADVLNEIDLIEDIAIGYGFNEIAQQSTYPRTVTIGSTLRSYKVQEAVRRELSASGCIETLNFSLCQASDAFVLPLPIALANAKTATFSHGRASLIPGMLRAASCGQFRPLPVKIFETAEVFCETSNDLGVSCEVKIGVLVGGTSDLFGELHGILDRIGVRLGRNYHLKEESFDWMISGRSCGVYLEGKRVGFAGVVGIKQLNEFKIPFPVSVFEIDME